MSCYMYIPNIKALGIGSRQEYFSMFFPIIAFVKHVNPAFVKHVTPRGDNLNKFGRTPLGDATYLI